MMRTGYLALIGVMGLAASPIEAKPRTHGQSLPAVRTVQLISWTHSGPETPEASQPYSASEQRAFSDGFRILDLDRRWVQHRMRSTTAAPPVLAGVAAIRPDDPFSPQARAMPVHDGPGLSLIGGSSSIAVPAWMQRASFSTTARFTPGCAASAYRPSGFLGLGAEARRQSYYTLVSSIACRYGLPVGLFDAMIIRESRYDPASVSPKDAFGLTQLMPATASSLGVDRFDIVQNLRGGASYLRQQLDRYGKYDLALAAYNAGPGRVRNAIPAIAETRAYVAEILRNWSRLSSYQRSVAVRAFTIEPAPSQNGAKAGAAVLTF